MNDSGTFTVFTNSVANSFSGHVPEKPTMHAVRVAPQSPRHRQHPNSVECRAFNKSDMQFGRSADSSFLELPYEVRQQLKRLTLGTIERDKDEEEAARLKVIGAMSPYEKHLYAEEVQNIRMYKASELMYSRMVAEGRKPNHSPRRPPACPMHEEVDRRTVLLLAKRGS